VEEKVSAIKTIKIFGRERTEIRLFTEGANNLARLMMHIVRLGTIQNILAVTVNSTAVFLFIYFGLQSFRNGEMSLGSIFWFIGLSRRLFDPAVALNDLITMEMPRVSVVLRRVFDLMDATPEAIDKNNAIELKESKGEISMHNVTFTYPGDTIPTLQNISFDIKSGEKVAIIGPSGAGKSTLLYLLMRFYDPEEGSIIIDKYNVLDIKLLSLRDRITLVMQEPVIFSGSVAENIKYARLDASDSEVTHAARDADLHNFVMTLPEGYQTIVGERGMALSGGQRQRLALAASLISRPAVLLLDDTTSALDAETEAKIRVTLQKLLQGKTSFMVTHRISSAIKCDKVIVLENGKLTQFGKPDELLKQDGLFARVYEQQTRELVDSEL
jgi:subfamily B ATP-binding cassette protein MsbA